MVYCVLRKFKYAFHDKRYFSSICHHNHLISNRKGSGVIQRSNRIVSAVGIHIEAEDTLAGADQAVCVDETAHLGVIVAGLEVIEPCLPVVVIAAVADRVDVGDVRRIGDGIAGSIGHRKRLAPGIIRVHRLRRAGGADKAHHVALAVVDVIVRRAVVEEAVESVRVVQELHHAAALLLADEAAARTVIFRLDAVDCLGRAQAAVIVGVHRRAAERTVDARKLAAFLPGHLHPVVPNGRVADGVVGNCAAVVARQLILPVRVAVAVVHCPRRVGRLHQRQRVLVLLKQVPAVVVGIGVPRKAAHSAAGHDRSPLQVLFGLGDGYHS